MTFCDGGFCTVCVFFDNVMQTLFPPTRSAPSFAACSKKRKEPILIFFEPAGRFRFSLSLRQLLPKHRVLPLVRSHRVRHFRFAGNAVTTRILRRRQVQTTSSSRPSRCFARLSVPILTAALVSLECQRSALDNLLGLGRV